MGWTQLCWNLFSGGKLQQSVLRYSILTTIKMFSAKNFSDSRWMELLVSVGTMLEPPCFTNRGTLVRPVSATKRHQVENQKLFQPFPILQWSSVFWRFDGDPILFD